MPIHKLANQVDVTEFRVACRDCTLFQLCLPLGIDDAALEQLDKIIKRRKPLKRNEHLFEVGNPFHAIYAVRSGSIKTYAPTEDGKEQVIGFHLPGELLGLDAINDGRHPCGARALEITSVCEIPFTRLEELGNRIPGLQHQILRIMSKEILDDHTLLTLLARKSAEERLAAFLLSLSVRFQRRGFSAKEFHLSMSRSDIGNYLGLAVETVSRIFTRFQSEQLLTAHRKHVMLHDPVRLGAIAGVSLIPRPTT